MCACDSCWVLGCHSWIAELWLGSNGEVAPTLSLPQPLFASFLPPALSVTPALSLALFASPLFFAHSSFSPHSRDRSLLPVCWPRWLRCGRSVVGGHHACASLHAGVNASHL